MSNQKDEFIEEPLVRMAQIWTKLYYHMANALISFGEEGEKALRKSIRDFAIDRGETMRRIAEKLNLPLTYETEAKLHDMPFNEICEQSKKYFPDTEGTYASEGFCPYAEWWRSYPNGTKVGKIYCDEFHHAQWAAFNPKHRVDMVEKITEGDPKCTLVSYVDGDDYDIKRQEALNEICSLSKKYGFIVDSSDLGSLDLICQKMNDKNTK
jgi:hypothetical protein